MSDDAVTIETSPPKSRLWLRRLRIAVSIFFGVLTVALVVMWVRSYRQTDRVSIDGRRLRFIAAPAIGRVGFLARISASNSQPLSVAFDNRAVDAEIVKEVKAIPAFLGFGLGRGSVVTVPIWFLVSLAVALAISPHLLKDRVHLPQRFSLRTLLIATTLVAIVLGLVVGRAVTAS